MDRGEGRARGEGGGGAAGVCGSRPASFILSAGAMSTEESGRLARCWSSARTGGVCLTEGIRSCRIRTNHSLENIYVMQIKMQDDVFSGLDLVLLPVANMDRYGCDDYERLCDDF